MSSDKICRNCKFLFLQDYGYSNWTVEGITADCLHNANPKLPTDNWYGKAPELNFSCPKFSAGEQIHRDCKHEEPIEGDPEALALYHAQGLR